MACGLPRHDEFGVVTVDLHDLNASLAKRALKAVIACCEQLAGGGVIFITGQGRHSVGLPVLRNIVLGALVRLERDRGWRVRDCGAGRLLLVVDEGRIPARYRSDMPLWIPLFFTVFGGLGVDLAHTIGAALGHHSVVRGVRCATSAALSHDRPQSGRMSSSAVAVGCNCST